MNTNRNTARVVGSLFLIAMVASLVGGTIVTSIISAPDPLNVVSQKETQLLFGVFLEILNALAVVGIGILMFTVIKEHNETMAVGYLGLRVIESVFCAFIVVGPLSLLAISKNYSKIGNLDVVNLDIMGNLPNAIRMSVVDWLIPIFFSLGALLLYSFLYRSKRLPRFISVWGLISAFLIMVLVAMMFLNVEVSLGMNMVIAMPIILNEIFLGIWLIAKGFNPPTLNM
jgi:hypothetical protein